MEQWGERSIWKQPKHCLAFETIISWIQEHTFERKIIQPYYYWSCRLCCGNGRYLPLPFEANPQLCSPKKSPKRTRNGNFAPNGVKNGPKRAAMVQKELKIDWKFLRIVFWKKIAELWWCVGEGVCQILFVKKLSQLKSIAGPKRSVVLTQKPKFSNSDSRTKYKYTQ